MTCRAQPCTAYDRTRDPAGNLTISGIASGCWQRDHPGVVFGPGDSCNRLKDKDTVADAITNGSLAVNPDPNDIDGDGLYDAGDSVGYTLWELPSLIELDAVTTAHGITPPLPPAEIGHECDHCYDNYVNQGFVLDRASTVGLILSTPCGINPPVRHQAAGI